MKQQLSNHPNSDFDNNKKNDDQIFMRIIKRLSVDDFRNLINCLDGKHSHSIVSILKIYPELIYVINNARRVSESGPFEMFKMGNWYFVYKNKELLFTNGSREIIEKIFRLCIYYEQLEFHEQEKANPFLMHQQVL